MSNPFATSKAPSVCGLYIWWLKPLTFMNNKFINAHGNQITNIPHVMHGKSANQGVYTTHFITYTSMICIGKWPHNIEIE